MGEPRGDAWPRPNGLRLAVGTLAVDEAEALRATVAEARRIRRPLGIVGHASKAFLGGPGGEPLSTLGHRGIVDYRPEELTLTARAGTPLAEVAHAVAENGQMLPFDPPRFAGGVGGEGTFGGAVACGLVGPARPWRGGVRDAMLGVEIVNGLGERLRFGGSVMKNVAGYDVSRLMAGARGTLGLILSACVRLQPAPAVEKTYRLECDAEQAHAHCRRWARLPLPITGTCFLAGALRVRLSGSSPAVTAARAEMALATEDDPAVWEELRDHRHAFFRESAARPLTRVSLPCDRRFAREDALIEWNGCQAWLLEPPPDELPEGAFATVFRSEPVASAVAGNAANYAGRVRRAFDPDGVLNPGVAS